MIIRSRRSAAPLEQFLSIVPPRLAGSGRTVELTLLKHLSGQLSASGGTGCLNSALTSGGSSGGFFSGLFKRLKSVASGLLGQVGQWFSANAGGLITKAQSWISNLAGGLLTQAGNWFSGLLAKWQTKLGS